MQPLTALVLYRTPTGWRYVIYAAGVMDGRLTDVPLAASQTLVQTAVVGMVEEGYRRRIHARWRTTDPDWWAAAASFAE